MEQVGFVLLKVFGNVNFFSFKDSNEPRCDLKDSTLFAVILSHPKKLRFNSFKD